MAKAKENADSLISSETLPEFEQLDKEYEALLDEVEKEETEKKGKKGRKKDKETEPTEPEVVRPELTPEDVEPWCCFPLDVWFARDGKQKLTKIERIAWSESCAKLINKWAPLFAQKFGAEIGAAITLTVIFGVRYTPNGTETSVPQSEHSDTGPQG